MDEEIFRTTASTVTMATYGYEVESEDDAYVKLVEKVNIMTVEPGAPGSTLPDLFPIRELDSYSYSRISPSMLNFYLFQCDLSPNGFLEPDSRAMHCKRMILYKTCLTSHSIL